MLRKGFIYSVLFVLTVFFLLNSCKSYREQQDKLPDTPYRGSIRVSADESFKPVLDEFVMVYEGRNPGTKINIEYKPEADCLRDLFNDSVRMVIATRGTTQDEQDAVIDSLKVGPKCLTVARDAIAVIVNPLDENSEFTMDEIKQVLTGKFKKNLIPVFDGLKATSTVRFIIDSVLRGDKLTPKAMAARNSEGVVDYVANNRGVVGFIGVSWIGNPEDTAQLSFLKKVKVASIESVIAPGFYCKAYQANIYARIYPMVRDLTYILKERYHGLGTGFAYFLGGEVGQIMFRRTYLAPALKNLGIRPVKLSEKEY
jgi:phosphate transport system substrate-binding protein